MSERITTEEVRQRYDELARRWRTKGIVDRFLGIPRLRRRHFSGLTGDVLDVACGTGENFKYLRTASSITAVDLSSEMVAQARKRAGQLGMNIAIIEGDAQQLSFPDDEFDTVISAFSSCTFPEYVAAFGEMARVTKPGGRILLVEHGRSSVGWIARRQDRNIGREYERSACRNNRHVGSELAESGLAASLVSSHLGMMIRVVIRV